MSRARTLRLDIAPSIYESLEELAIESDCGITDIIRRAIIQWIDDNPPPERPADA